MKINSFKIYSCTIAYLFPEWLIYWYCNILYIWWLFPDFINNKIFYVFNKSTIQMSTTLLFILYPFPQQRNLLHLQRCCRFYNSESETIYQPFLGTKHFLTSYWISISCDIIFILSRHPKHYYYYSGQIQTATVAWSDKIILSLKETASLVLVKSQNLKK